MNFDYDSTTYSCNLPGAQTGLILLLRHDTNSTNHVGSPIPAARPILRNAASLPSNIDFVVSIIFLGGLCGRAGVAD